MMTFLSRHGYQSVCACVCVCVRLYFSPVLKVHHPGQTTLSARTIHPVWHPSNVNNVYTLNQLMIPCFPPRRPQSSTPPTPRFRRPPYWSISPPLWSIFIYLFLCSGRLLPLVPNKTLLAVHDGLFPEDEGVAVGKFGEGRLAHVHKDVPGAFYPVEEGVNFDASSEIWSGDVWSEGENKRSKLKLIIEPPWDLCVPTIPAAAAAHL